MYRYNNNIGKRDYALFRDISVSSIPEKNFDCGGKETSGRCVAFLEMRQCKSTLE